MLLPNAPDAKAKRTAMATSSLMLKRPTRKSLMAVTTMG
jgi:hypothetical protein